MEEIENTLIEIAKQQLNRCKGTKEVPSKEVLDTMQILISFYNRDCH